MNKAHKTQESHHKIIIDFQNNDFEMKINKDRMRMR